MLSFIHLIFVKSLDSIVLFSAAYLGSGNPSPSTNTFKVTSFSVARRTTRPSLINSWFATSCETDSAVMY
jgi:hypothetical protein